MLDIIESTPTRYTIEASRELVDMVIDQLQPNDRREVCSQLRGQRGRVVMSVSFATFALLSQFRQLYFA